MIVMLCVVLFTPLAFSYDDDSDPEEFKPKSYDDAKVLRVKYTQGEAYVRRSYDDGFEEATINLPIFEKDKAGTTDGRLEIYLGRLNYLRLDQDTEVVFDKVPEMRKTDLTLRVIKGGIYLDIENIDFERDIEIQTPDCGIFVLDKGMYRINVSEGGRTEFYVFDGIAEVAGDNYNRNVRENQKIVMFDGRVKERPFYFYSSDTDDFDQWNRERTNVIGYARYSSSRYLDSGYEEYEYELSRNGRWEYNPTYSTYIWIPYHVGVDWRPYYHGRWVYNPYYGYVWSSFDTWGFFTHHYGRWHWDPYYRWYWIPGYHWSPAWVSWFWNDYYYGWCPLSWWNRPIIIYDGTWWRHYRYRRGIPFHSRSTTIIKKSHLAVSGVHKAALKGSSLAKLSKDRLQFKGHSPNLKPHISKVNVINARGKTVVYKKNGLVTASKYKVVKSGIPGSSRVIGKKDIVYKYSGKKVSKNKVSRYSKSTYKKSKDSSDSRGTGTPYYKSTKSYKYKSYKTPGTYKKYSSSSKRKSSTYTYKSSKPYSKSYKSSKSKSYRSKSPKSRSSSKSKTKSSSSSTYKSKKKKESPSYSYSPSYRSSNSNSSGSYSSSYSSRARKQGSYKPSSYTKKRTASSSYRSSYSSSRSYRSGSYSSYKSPARSSYKSSSSYKYRPSKSYSRPSYRSSSSYKSSSKSYSRSSSKSSYRSSSRSTRSSSSRSSSSRSSSSRSSAKRK